jgi:hypothetical protein
MIGHIDCSVTPASRLSTSGFSAAAFSLADTKLLVLVVRILGIGS